MADVFKRLAQKLDRLPNGFPATANGVEIRILKKIFTPEDAGLALSLQPMPATAEHIAGRLRQRVDTLRAALDRMAARGQIASITADGVQKYALVPFVIGIYEFQLNHLDKELADLVEEYLPHLMKSVGGTPPALARVVPVNASIDPKLEVLRYEDMRGLIREARSFALRECICRKERALQGHPCTHPLETCMQFSSEERAFDYFNYGGRVISQDDALRTLDATEREGLVHATYNVRNQPMFVCNCCSCCCGFLRGLREFSAPHVLTRSSFVATVDQSTCNECGVCADERCPVGAIAAEPGNYAVLAERCLGCGVCAVTCPEGSIRLVRREDADRAMPPKDIIHWSVERMSARSGLLTRLMLKAWLARHDARSA